MKLFSFFSMLLMSLFMLSCHFNSQYINRAEDIEEAKQVTTKLYDVLKSKNYETAVALFSKKFFEVTDTNKLFNLFKMTQEKLGNMVDVTVDKSESRIVLGTDASSNYAFIYKTKYEKYEATETINLRKEKDGEIRIVGYHINSDGFILSK